jgi:hypothetical protein
LDSFWLKAEDMRVDSQPVPSPNVVAAIETKGSELGGAQFTLGTLRI